ncbi:MAG: hypothetical protein ACK4HH_08615, partial [Microcella sp.]
MVDARTLLATALADAWALVAPIDCAGCGAPDRALCLTCAHALRSRPQRAVLEPPIALAPAALVPGLDAPATGAAAPGGSAALPVVAALPYEGVARATILALKHEGRTELARWLAP